MHETVLTRCYDDNMDILYHSLELKYLWVLHTAGSQ